MANTEKNGTELSKVDLNARTKALLESPSYIKAYYDDDFMKGDSTRELRLLAEYMKANQMFKEKKIVSTIIVFGSARIKSPVAARDLYDKAETAIKKNPESPQLVQALTKARQDLEFSKYYQQAEDFAELVSRSNQFYLQDERENHHPVHYVICTGGGPGIMEAANRGANDVGAMSIGLNISLPFEQKPNPYITPELCFQYHYFAIRKLHFLLRAKALVAFPGGFGTLDELFEGLTLRQTGRMQTLPIILFGKSFWQKLINFDYLVECGMISPKDLDLINFVETADEAWNVILKFYTDRRTND